MIRKNGRPRLSDLIQGYGAPPGFTHLAKHINHRQRNEGKKEFKKNLRNYVILLDLYRINIISLIITSFLIMEFKMELYLDKTDESNA